MVKDVVLYSIWWDFYGVDLIIMFVNFVFFFISFFLIGFGCIFLFVIGYFLFFYVYVIFIVKLVYVVVYNVLVGLLYFFNRFLFVFFIEIWGGFIE